MSHTHDHENHGARGPLAHDLDSGGSPWAGASVTDPPRAAVTPLGEPPAGVTRSSDGTPPQGLGLEDARRWAAGWALHIQSRLTSQSGVSFHGTPGPREVPGSGRVTIERLPHQAGYSLLGRLCNVRDPGQPFDWGRLGAGPSSLAKSLLVAALGRDAACRTCLGTGKVTWLGVTAQPLPWEPAHDAIAATEAETVAIVGCDVCEQDGLAVGPKLYHGLVTELVAGRWVQGRGWHVSRMDLLGWLARQNLDPALAITAAEVAFR
jgi:hypothetical protein